MNTYFVWKQQLNGWLRVPNHIQSKLSDTIQFASKHFSDARKQHEENMNKK